VNQGRQSRWRQIIRNVLWTVVLYMVLVVAIIIVLGYVREWDWTGLVKDKAYTKRTLWDWLQLLIIPAVLAGVGLWFNRQQREQELQTADRRAQDEALQAYLDQMSAMLMPNIDQPSLYDEPPPNGLRTVARVRTVARARTLTVLPRLDGDRKARVVQFLYEAGLITKGRPILALGGADLIEADLTGAILSDADLSGADLSGATLHYARLSEADLRAANLRYANLIEADLSEADLTWAFLEYAKLNGAYVTDEQLAQCLSLKGATMPDGQKYEDQRKSKDSGNASENSGA
jgi:hypothetical protein